MPTPPRTEFVATITNDAIGSSNFANVGLCIGGAGLGAGVGYWAMNLVAFIARCSIAVDTRITGIDYRDTTMAGSAPAPFDATYWSALVLGDAGLPAMTAYGASIGIGALLPRGASTLVQEKTGTPGRSYEGRMNIPYLPNGAITAGGEISSSTRAAIEQMYGWYILGDGGNPNWAGGVSAGAMVYSKTLDVTTTITVPRVSTNPSRLRSRQR